MAAPGKKAPCRLHFFLAREAPVGVILRRGPSRWVRLVRWETETDEFQPGQWFRGRIYEQRCDLSPDGQLFVYFAAKHRPPGDPDASLLQQFFGILTGRERTVRPGERVGYAWTAISRPPWLTALALWPKWDSWDGGGVFEASTRLYLNHFPHEAAPHPDHVPPAWFTVALKDDETGEDWPILGRRLRRDGWQPIQESIIRRLGIMKGYATDRPGQYRKPHPTGALALGLAHGLREYSQFFDFTLHAPDDHPLTTPPGIAWADWDHRGRLVFAREGKVFAAEVSEGGVGPERELADFNDQQPEEIVSPEWARQWPATG